MVQVHEERKKEHRRLQIANQFHILYQTQKHFHTWIITTQDSKHKRAAAVALQQELERVH